VSSKDDEEMRLDLEWVQRTLKDNGFDPGPVNGEWGPDTLNAVMNALKALLPDQA